MLYELFDVATFDDVKRTKARSLQSRLEQSCDSAHQFLTYEYCRVMNENDSLFVSR